MAVWIDTDIGSDVDDAVVLSEVLRVMQTNMRILIVAKQSKLEWEQHKFGLSRTEIEEKYKHEHAKLPAILAAHEAQLATRELLKDLLPTADLIMMHQLIKPVAGYDVVISLGGDNSFTYVTHFVENTPVVGLNADPTRSTGALCRWGAHDIPALVNSLATNAYTVEEWTRLQAHIGGKPGTLALSEYFIGERFRKDMSRHVVEYRGKSYELKSSGIIIATGAGSTGWYESAGRYLAPQQCRIDVNEGLEITECPHLTDNRFAVTEKKARFVISEPFLYRPNGELLTGELVEGEELVIHSLNDNEGTINADSWHEHSFPRGATAVVKIGKPLRVIVPRK